MHKILTAYIPASWPFGAAAWCSRGVSRPRGMATQAVCMCVCDCVNVCVSVDVRSVCVCVFSLLFGWHSLVPYAHLHVCTLTYARAHKHTYKHVINTHTYTHTHTHTHIHTYTHTHTHTCTSAGFSKGARTQAGDLAHTCLRTAPMCLQKACRAAMLCSIVNTCPWCDSPVCYTQTQTKTHTHSRKRERGAKHGSQTDALAHTHILMTDASRMIRQRPSERQESQK
jgi:hypothetical protein